jgi:hypothetical protein
VAPIPCSSGILVVFDRAPSALATGSLVVRVSSFCITHTRTDLIFAFENLEGIMNEIVDVDEFLVQSAAVLGEGAKSR